MRISSVLSIAVFLIVSVSRHQGQTQDKGTDSENVLSLDGVLSPLRNRCFDTTHIPSWWSYVWCFKNDVRQVHYDDSHTVETSNLIGSYVKQESSLLKEVYRSNVSDCQTETGISILRRADVIISCCREERWSAMHDRLDEGAVLGTFVERAEEPSKCVYILNVCSDLLCTDNSRPAGLDENQHSTSISSSGLNRHDSINSEPITSIRDREGEHNREPTTSSREASRDPVDTLERSAPHFIDFLVDQISRIGESPSDGAHLTRSAQLGQLERVREMFSHGYDMYMKHAQPEVRLSDNQRVLLYVFEIQTILNQSHLYNVLQHFSTVLTLSISRCSRIASPPPL